MKSAWKHWQGLWRHVEGGDWEACSWMGSYIDEHDVCVWRKQRDKRRREHSPNRTCQSRMLLDREQQSGFRCKSVVPRALRVMRDQPFIIGRPCWDYDLFVSGGVYSHWVFWPSHEQSLKAGPNPYIVAIWICDLPDGWPYLVTRQGIRVMLFV